MSEQVVITFSDVGPKKLTWSETFAVPLTWKALMRSIRKRRALMSSSVEFDENGGIYVGVLRRVGTWSVASPVPVRGERARP